ncbi:MAG: LPXTG cell wall anchor domain-containing protein [Terriglobales bacterium]
MGRAICLRKVESVELAKETNEPVLATPTELDAAPIETLNTAPVEAVAPTGEPVDLAQVVEPPPADAPMAAATQPAADPLPQTASSLPMIALIGLMMIGAGLALSSFSKRAV